MLVPTFLVLSFLAGAQPAKVPTENSRLAVIQKMPHWLLIDQNGKEIRSCDLDAPVVLVSFIFTTCSGSCQATTHRMEKVQEALKARGLLKKNRVRLLSITLD